jgi:hypothetical protein
MIKKTITYKNFLDQEETGDFYFNMSKGELVKQQMSAVNQQVESFQDKLEKIAKNLQGEALVEVLDEIIMEGYGEKSTDGKHFVKVRNGVKLVENFMSSGAYSELVVELCTKEGAMADFINGLVPADLRDSVNKEVATQQAAQRPVAPRVPQDYQKKAEAPKPVVTQVPEIPTIEETADPVLESPAVSNDMTTEELEAMLAARRASAPSN